MAMVQKCEISGQASTRRGRPRKNLDGNLIRRLAGIGCTNKEIAAVTGVSEDTLERNFAGVIEKGRETAKASLRRFQWKSAAGGNVTMQIWLGKQLLGQTDKVVSQPPEEWKFGLGDGPRPNVTG